MSDGQQNLVSGVCRCGQVRFESKGPPIFSCVCYCEGCQKGGRLIESRSPRTAVLDPDGGANYVVFRDDRWTCVMGQENLLPVKLSEASRTTRFTTSCCNSAMFLKFGPGHWVSTYRNRFENDRFGPVEMRNFVQKRNPEWPFPDDAPRHQTFPLKLFGKLIAARVAMAIGR